MVSDAPEVIALSSASSTSRPTTPRVSAQGSDLSDLPTLFPDADWLPIEGPILSMAVVTRAIVNGVSALATLDTGATVTTMSQPMAERLGVLDDDTPRGRPVRALDAHGNVVMGEKLRLRELRLGTRSFTNVEATVVGDAPDLLLVGADILQRLDLYIAADEGLVGLFDAGRSPAESTDRVVPLERGDRQLVARARAAGSSGEVRFPLIVDSGAWTTTVPLLPGLHGGLRTDVNFESTTVAVGGEQMNRGRFVLEPLRLGPDDVSVGRVLALGGTLGGTLEEASGLGLLGNDVLMRQPTVISFARSELRFKGSVPRPPWRERGPGGAPCSDDHGAPAPCVRVALVPKPDDNYDATDLPGVCLQIDVDESYAGRTVELAITGVSSELMNGGAIRAFMTANDAGAHSCFHVWRQLEHLGLREDTPLSLRWVRTEGVEWPCDPVKTRCITFTGPLARLPAK